MVSVRNRTCNIPTVRFGSLYDNRNPAILFDSADRFRGTGPNRTEPNRTEPNRTEPKTTLGKVMYFAFSSE